MEGSVQGRLRITTAILLTTLVLLAFGEAAALAKKGQAGNCLNDLLKSYGIPANRAPTYVRRMAAKNMDELTFYMYSYNSYLMHYHLKDVGITRKDASLIKACSHGRKAKSRSCKRTPCGETGLCRFSLKARNKYACACMPGHAGDYCEKDLCSPNPCGLKGACYYTGSGFFCRCPKGFTGRTCKKKMLTRQCARPLGNHCGRRVDTAYWLGYLNNRNTLLSSRSGAAPATFSTSVNSAPKLVNGGSPKITFAQSGVVFYSYHQDTYHNFDYLTLHSRINNGIVNRELQRNSQGKWDGLSISGVAPVSAKSYLTFTFELSRSGRLQHADNGVWGAANAFWISEAAGVHTMWLSTINAVELRSHRENTVKFKILDSSPKRNSPFQAQPQLGRVGFRRDGVLRYTFHQDVRHQCANIRLNAALETFSDVTRTNTKRLLVTEEQDNTKHYWDGLSISGSTFVGSKDTFTITLDYMGGCLVAIDNGVWGVMTLAWLPSDVAWSSGPMVVDASTLVGTIGGKLRFAKWPENRRAVHAKDPVQMGEDFIYFRYTGTAMYDLHIAVDNVCKNYAYVEAKVNLGIVSREITPGPTSNAVDGLSLSGSVTATAGQELRFFLRCNEGYIRKVRSGSLSLMWVPKA